jgi:hypothetical protein
MTGDENRNKGNEEKHNGIKNRKNSMHQKKKKQKTKQIHIIKKKRNNDRRHTPCISSTGSTEPLITPQFDALSKRAA